MITGVVAFLFCVGAAWVLLLAMGRCSNPRDAVSQMGPDDDFGHCLDPDGPGWPPLT